MSDPSEPSPATKSQTIFAKISAFFKTLQGVVIGFAAIVTAIVTIVTGWCALPLVGKFCKDLGSNGKVSCANFEPTPPKNPIERKPEYEKVLVSVYYRESRCEDAQKTVGALNQAGFKTIFAEDDFSHALVPNKKPGLIWIKSTPAQVALKERIRWILSGELVPKMSHDQLKLAPVHLRDDAGRIQLRGEVQVQLY